MLPAPPPRCCSATRAPMRPPRWWGTRPCGIRRRAWRRIRLAATAPREARPLPDPPRRLLCARHPHLGLVAALRRPPELRGGAGEAERLGADVITALGRLSPAVEVGGEESCCDLSGNHAAFPDEGRWAAAVARARVETLDGGLPAVGVGSTRFVA